MTAQLHDGSDDVLQVRFDATSTATAASQSDRPAAVSAFSASTACSTDSGRRCGRGWSIAANASATATRRAAIRMLRGGTHVRTTSGAVIGSADTDQIRHSTWHATLAALFALVDPHEPAAGQPSTAP